MVATSVFITALPVGNAHTISLASARYQYKHGWRVANVDKCLANGR